MEHTNGGLKITTEKSFMTDDIKETVIEYGENFKIVDKISTEALNKSNQAVYTSTSAKDTANSAKITADTTAKQLENIILESGTSDAEIVAARTNTVTAKSYVSVGDRLDSEYQNVNGDIAKKVDRTYFDMIIANLVDGSPRELFYSVATLQSTYPTGEIGTYLVFDISFTDGAHTFMWKDGAWQDLGAYQAVGIADGSVDDAKIADTVKIKNAEKMSLLNTIASAKSLDLTKINLPYTTGKSEIVSVVLRGDSLTQAVLNVTSANIFTTDLIKDVRVSVPSTSPHVEKVNDDIFKIVSIGTGSAYDVLVTYKFYLQLEPNTSYFFKSINSVKITDIGTNPNVGKFSILGDGTLLMSANDNNEKIFMTGSSGLIDITLNIQNAQTPDGTTQEITISNMIIAKSAVALDYTSYKKYTELVPAVKGQYKTALQLNAGDIVNIDTNLNTYIESYDTNKKTIVCFGDSITERDYAQYIAQKTNLHIVNVGFGGTRMGQHPTPRYNAYCMVELVDAIVSGDWTTQDADTTGAVNYPEHLARLKSIDFNDVEYVSIAFGTNDWGGGHTPNLPVDNPDNLYAKNNYIGATRYVVKSLLQAYPHLKIILVSPYYRFDVTTNTDADDGWRPVNNPNHHIKEYVDALQNTAKELKVPFIDMYYSLGINKYNRSIYFSASDGVHPLENGLALIGARLAGNLSKFYGE